MNSRSTQEDSTCSQDATTSKQKSSTTQEKGVTSPRDNSRSSPGSSASQQGRPTSLQWSSTSQGGSLASHGGSSTSQQGSPANRQDDPPHAPRVTAHAPSALRTPGTRTPRKVQWGDSDDLESLASERSYHMLDENGLDHKGFKELTEALERHRTGTPLKEVHVYSPLSPSPASSGQNGKRHLASQNEETSYPPYAASSGYFDSTQTLALPTRNVPDNLIEEDEDAGLPGTKDLRQYSLKKAENVVQTHLRKRPYFWRSKPHLRLPHSKERQRRKQDRSHEDIFTGTSGEKDVEGHVGEPSFHGGGILSTLLNLYHSDDPQSEVSSSRSSFDEESRPRKWNDSVAEFSGIVPQGSNLSPSKTSDRSKKKRHHIPCLKVPSMFGKISRPAAARSAGGVFGPLIASTGNLAGVAAPYSSRLQPNIKQPGYRLSRYEIETKEAIPRPPIARQKDNKLYSESRGPVAVEGITTPPTSLANQSQESFYRTGSKVNLTSILGGYTTPMRPGRRSGYSTPHPGSPRGSDEALPPATSPFYKRNKRKKAEVFITRHVAQIILREEFIMKLTRAMMMFGGPPHRLQSQIMSAARVLDIQLSALYLPDVVLLSFDDSGTGTSHIKLIRQGSALNIDKLTDAFCLYWKVIHDKLCVCDASVALDGLMKKKPCYNSWQQVFIGGMCSAAICTVSFSGSFIDAVISFPLGALLVIMQIISFRNVLFTYVFEVIATLTFSFISAALATTHKLCYSAITSSSVVLILPGFLVLTGALELMSRNIVPGSVRLLFSVVYALFLGFGFSIGAELFELFTSHQVYGAEDYTCSLTHDQYGPWYQRTPSRWWAFLTVPMFSFFLSMRNQCPWRRKEMFLLVAIASVGWVTNYWTGRRYVGQSDIIAAVGAFAVGLISNLYARIFSGNAFVVMITGILFQLPSGLGSGGLLSYASQQAEGSSSSYISGFRTALKLVSVAIGLTVGLGLSSVLTHPIQSRKREAGIFSL